MTYPALDRPFRRADQNGHHRPGGRPRPEPVNPVHDILVTRRPWGQFTQLACNTPVTVKIITVEPGERLSLQRHRLRGELWQLLDAPMDVTVGTWQRTAMPGETVWVPRGAVHRMGNPGRLPGRVLEVAFGPFDEDDIERLEDDYARR